MIEKLKRFILDVLFELYGILHNWFLKKARECVDEDQQKKFNYWIKQADKCIDRRADILDKLFT